LRSGRLVLHSQQKLFSKSLKTKKGASKYIYVSSHAKNITQKAEFKKYIEMLYLPAHGHSR